MSRKEFEKKVDDQKALWSGLVEHVSRCEEARILLEKVHTEMFLGNVKLPRDLEERIERYFDPH